MSNYSSSQYADSPNTPWFKALNAIPENTTVLDIGCSSGNFGAELIQKKNCIVDGVELNQTDVKLAKKKLRNIYTFNIENETPTKLEGLYDVVYYGDVIEHLVDPVGALKNTRKLLKKNGIIVFSIPNMAHMSVRMMLLAGDFEYGETGLLDKTHLHYYTRQEIERVFYEADYSIDKLDWVRRDVPIDILKKQLASLGLSASKSFYDKSKQVGAAAYQYIGVASMGAAKQVKRKTTSPAIDEFEKHVKSLNYEHKAEIKRIQLHYENQLERQRTEYEQVLRTSIRVPGTVKKVIKKNN